MFDPGAVVEHIWGTFDLVAFNVILDQFSELLENNLT